MCLKINKVIHKKLFGKYIPIKTTADLIVYKYVKVNWKEKNIVIINSPIQDFTFIIDNMYYTKLKMGESTLSNTVFVFNGFHSFINKPFRYSVYFTTLFNSNGMATCVIPKGSKVFISENYEQIVSNKIKIIGVEEI